MAASNLSRDVDGHGDNSGGTSLPPLPRPDNGDNVRPVPLWEIEFCRNAYDIPWETFCENKQFIGLYRNVMDWDDSEAFKNFEEAKERFRAKYFGEGGPNNSNNNFHGGGSSSNWHQQGVDPGHTSSGTGRMLIGGGTMWMSGAFTGGAMKWNGGGGRGNGTGRNWNVGSGGSGNGNDNGSGRNRNGGGGSSSNWNCFGRGNQRKQHEGQHQLRNGGGIQRNQEEGRHQMRSGGQQQQGQGRMKMEWRLVQHNRAPKDDPAA
ncbi:unnamed protein product [Miscanthus lutarioriparius]|uniref:Uncharacterized protein n=1 Tax=Miscanthus lutarioriparius TaxID=422564 RepID=A0A811RLD8_9POAL|nr:unnamed protein product [Miscanthus lutarioriparius]